MKSKNVIILAVSIVLTGLFVYSLFFVTPTFVVSFNTDTEVKINDLTVKKDQTFKKPEDPTKEGFKFVGWYLNDEEYNFDTPVTKNIKLSAKWEEIKEEKKEEKKSKKTSKNN